MVEKKKIIDKKFIPTLISIAVLIILAIVSYPIFFGKQNPPSGEDNQKSFLNFKPSEVNYIEVEVPSNISENFKLELKNKDWYVNGEEAYNPQIGEMLTVLSSVKIKDKITDSSYLPQFELAPPNKKLTIGFKNPKRDKLKVLIGGYTPVTNEIYAKYALKPDVYIVDKFIYSGISINPRGLWNRDIFRIDPDNLEELIITKKDKTQFKFSLTKKGWFVEMPNGKNVKADENVIIGIVNNVFGNQAGALIKKNATDINKYKLNDPIMTIEAFDKDKKHSTVLLANIIPSTQVHYIMNMNNRNVYVINKNKIADLFFNEIDVRNKKLIVPHLYDFDKVVITIGKKEYPFTLNRKKMWNCYNLDKPVEIQHQFIEDLSTFLIDYITFDEIDKTKEKTGLNKPQMTIAVYEKSKFETKGYKPYMVTIGSKAKDGNYYVQLSNDPYLYKLSPSTVKYIKTLGDQKQR